MNGVVRVRRTYLGLTMISTLATSMIWGVNTLFLLDAGLTNTQAFTANAAFSVGQLLFEVPTGVVADTKGRKLSYLLGSATLFASTILYLYMWEIEAGLAGWLASSVVLGLGFTFFSGAVEAWLADALVANEYPGELDTVLGQGQAVMGGAMLVGSVVGGYLAQIGNLGTPYFVRAGLLATTFVIAAVLMRDEGFAPDRSITTRQAMASIVETSIEYGYRNRPVRWLMFTAPALTGTSAFIFYAMQPYLLELYGDPDAYGVAGIASAVVAGAQILGGMSVPFVRRLSRRRTSILLLATGASVLALLAVGLVPMFPVVVGCFVGWALAGAIAFPVRQGFINNCLPSSHRATVLSFDAFLGSAGGVVTQPVLGRVADGMGYGASYAISAGVQALAIPFLVLARREQSVGDVVVSGRPGSNA